VVTTAETVPADPAEVPATPSPAGVAHRARRTLAEAAAVLISPAAAFYLLRIRAMAPPDLPDPSMHTIYLVQPRDMFTRYAAAFTPTARLREAARVGFLVPARIAYLLFGGVPGFFVTRYAFALIAVVPVYLLLRRLYGPGAGALGIVVILSCPVVLTAWGTDYPDSAVVSYAAGALACLAMPCAARWRRWWLAGGAVLLTAAVWSHGIGALLTVTTLASYAVVRVLRDRRDLVADAALLLGVAVVVTAGLSVASELLLGHFDFVLPTWNAYRYLSQPSQVAMWHSSNWRWAPYVTYLLVPPAAVAAFVVTFARRSAKVPTPQLLVGVVTIGQVVVYFLMQFFGNVETLEMHFFFSTLWGAVCVALAVTLAEIARRSFAHRWGQWLPSVVLFVVALAYSLAYEVYPHTPSFGWLPYGALVGVFLVAVAAAARRLSRVREGAPLWIGTTVALAAIAGSSLLLTVAGIPPHPLFPGTVADPAPAYAGAIGGSAGDLVDEYRVAVDLPLFVGTATYAGEQALTWWPHQQAGPLTEAIGIYHSGYNSLPSSLPDFTAADRARLEGRRAPELVLLSMTGKGFAAALRALAPFDPTRLRGTVLSSGAFHLHVWLIYLNSFAPAARS
jgi:Dolichyl-phosphate-mannose-protein mannosyltransferase